MNLAYENRYDREPSVPIRVRYTLTGREVVVDAVVDTGSNVTMLEGWLAGFLGLDLGSADQANVVGVGGVLAGVAMAEVEIQVLRRPELSTFVVAAFLPTDAPPMGSLIGTDVLEHLDFGLAHSNRMLYFGLPV